MLSFEEAVRLLTDVPARLYGWWTGPAGRGMVGDITVFDPATVGRRAAHRDDLPGSEPAVRRVGGSGARAGQRVEVVTGGDLTGASLCHPPVGTTPSRSIRPGLSWTGPGGAEFSAPREGTECRIPR